MITVKVKGIPELQAYLRTVALGAKNYATRMVTEYIIGMEQNSDTGAHAHGLMHYVPYQYVSVQQAYGGFKSDKQRRYVMAMIREGRIDPGVPHRTGELQGGWGYNMTSDGRYTIKNRTPYAEYVMGDERQSNMHRLIGWRKVSEVVKSNLKGAFRYATSQVKKWLASKKK